MELIQGRLRLNNPVMAASGTFGYGIEFAERDDVTKIGGIVCKGITLDPRAGHPPPRIVETAAGALNAIGLANIGVDAVIQEMAPQWERMAVPVLVNINGETVEEYVEVARRLDGVPGVSGIELNVSCPNVARGGMTFGMEPGPASDLTAAVRKANSSPLFVKLTPNTESMIEVARAVIGSGAEGLTVANTYLGVSIDARTGKPRLANVTGGLSGPAIKPLSLRLVLQVAEAVSVPIIGCGGIMNGEDAAEFLAVGASAVQVGTATLVSPFALPRIARQLEEWLARNRSKHPNQVGEADGHNESS